MMSDPQCPSCPEQMIPYPASAAHPLENPGNEWVYRCGNGHERPATPIEQAMLR